MEKTYKVEKMNCGHCEAKITKALTESGVESKVDLDNKLVTVNTDLSDAEVTKIVADAGYEMVAQ